jgi:hypothetical protein
MNNLRTWRERQQARADHERVNTEEEEVEEDVITHPLEESTPPESTALADSASSEEEEEEQEEEEVDVENQRPNNPDAPTLASTVNARRSRSRRSSSSRRRFSLEDLEEERELARRRTSGCVLIAAFVLFRLWIQAVATSDFGLLLLCLVGTSWTARFIRHNREREEHLDRLIVEYNENGGSSNDGGGDMRMLSFQAQLALAIIESQRQMMQGGYGHPDGAQNTPGVSEEAMEHWKKFAYKSSEGLPDSCGHKSMGDDEEPHCSICLCEYEEKDDLVCLPCGHVYHGDCISSWCSNHQRCPLCNLDLESVTGTETTDDETTSS